MKHRINLTNTDGTRRYRGPDHLSRMQRRCTCGWIGARRENHPPMSIQDAIDSL